MPIIYDKDKLANILKHQPNCSLCDERSWLNKYKVVCDICEKWICLDCSDIPEEMFLLAERNQTKIPFLCGACEVELPKVRDLIKIQQIQQQNTEDIAKLKTKVATNTTSITKLTEDSADTKIRLTKFEDALKRNNLLDEEFPALPTHQQHLSELQQDFTNQKRETHALSVSLKKQQED